MTQAFGNFPPKKKAADKKKKAGRPAKGTKPVKPVKGEEKFPLAAPAKKAPKAKRK